MWLRNVVFVGLCCFGLSALAFSLLRGDRIAVSPPRHTSYLANAEYRDVVARINTEFRQHWESRGLQHAPPAAALTVVRRLSLGLTGTVPSLEEIRILESLPDEQRMEWWVSHLLADRRYSDYVAERLARAYVGTENGPFIIFRRRRFVSWLSDSLRENVPYDQIVRRLISDDGIWTSSPAVNFVSVTVRQGQDDRPDPIRLAGRTTRAFLGMRIDCLQCHDDRLGNTELGTPDLPRSGLQSDFHQLAAFFSDARISLLGIHDQADQPYKYQYLNRDEEQVISPIPPFSSQLLPTAGTRREQLAQWVTHPQNKPFARATVNRMWALLFGRPLVEPIDEIPLYGRLPPAMEVLADDFAAHGFDLQRLIRLIAASDPFQLDSRAEFEVTPAHEQHWAVFPLTRLRPEQVAGAIIQAASLRTLDANAHILFRLARFQQEGEFVKRYGDTGEDEFEDRGGTITQRLLMMNGDLIADKGKEEPLTNAAAKIAVLAPNDPAAIEVAYLATLTRRPTPAESARFLDRLSMRTFDTNRQLEMADIYWVLFNSTEFSWNH
jgi:hypothetical protein